MIRLNQAIPRIRTERPPLTTRAKLLMTFSNLLMLIGAILLLYVGGIYADAEYNRYAARGDTDVPAPKPVIPAIEEAVPLLPSQRAEAEPAPFVPIVLNNTEAVDGQVTSTVPNPVAATKESTITRLVIPKIDIDSKVVSVGWEIKVQKGTQYAVWQVAEYAVGHHLGSANPGDGTNIVLAGHVGGYGKVFKDLIKLSPGDQITLYSAGQQYLYIVTDKMLVTEEGVSPEKQAENAQYITPTDSEMITMITCWPPTGKDRFAERVIVRAVPFKNNEQGPAMSHWSAR
ncbi:MAG: sortase [Roseiflexaceae bacterium]|nr:sortase [Roseiflexaceae bacterium]